MIEWISSGVVYSLLKDIVRGQLGERRKLSSSERLERRQKWKPLFEARLLEMHRKGLCNDVIIRDLKRLDEYPKVDGAAKDISAWFRLGFVGATHRGILVAMRNGTLTKHKDGEHWRFTDYATGEQGHLKVVLLGSIPYDYIDSVDWDGDEYYGYPHIYCLFAHRKEPYEHLGLYTETGPLPPDGLPIYDEVTSYDDARKFSRKFRIGDFG